MEEFEFYISANGRLIIPKYKINYLVNLSESSIPSMPEANESTARVAGRDGDIVLSTTYEPISFNIVCYTEDNLTMQEKVEEERKVNRFLNDIKKNTKQFTLEKYKKFYNVKYNGATSIINYPKHLQFSIPFKSSDSYSKSVFKNTYYGNSTFKSNTIEDAGCIITIEGFANHPKISLNDYVMEFDTDIIQGTKVIIDSSKSTITHINKVGQKTNVLRYFNHQFCKIKNGENKLQIISGIDDPKKVSIEWHDLDL